MGLGISVKILIVPRNVSPETLQTLGVLAIGLGFVLIGLGGFSTYHASQNLQHQAELREAEQKGELDAQILTLMLKNQQLQTAQAQAATAPPAPAAATPPPTYFRPPSPPAPTTLGAAPLYTPPPIAEAPPDDVVPSPAPAPQPDAVPEAPVVPPSQMEEPPDDWHEPESLEPEVPLRFLSIRQQEVIADTLRAHGRHVVTIESSYGDPVSKEFAEELGTAFEEADWIVSGVSEHRGLPLASGVTVSAASFPPQQETRAVYEALLSAGIAVTQQLDPRQRSSETVVLVGKPL
jgi:hypothetical protein